MRTKNDNHDSFGLDVLLIIVLSGCIVGQMQYVGDWMKNDGEDDTSCIYPWSSLLIVHFAVSIIDRIFDQCYNKSTMNDCILKQNGICCNMTHIFEIILRAIWIFLLYLYSIAIVVDYKCYKVDFMRFIPVILWILICNILLWYFIIKTLHKMCKIYVMNRNNVNNNDYNESLQNECGARPLTPIEIDHLVKVDVNQDDESKCVICLEKLYDRKNEMQCKQLPSCKHILHAKCIDHWLNLRGDCPVCRAIVVVEL